MEVLDALIAPFGKNNEGELNPPNPTQRKVWEWVEKVCFGETKTNGIPVLYLQGGVGSGKTRAIMGPVIEMLTQFPGIRVLWGRQDFNDLRLSAMETFFEIMPPDLILDKNVQEHRYVIGQPKDGKAQIFFRELKDLGGLGSQEFAVIAITEVLEISESAFRTVKMRCRQANMPIMILMEGNPPNVDHWLYRFTDPDDKDYDPDIEIWKVSTEENKKNLPPAYYNSLQNTPPSWRKKFRDGEFGFAPDGKPFYEGYVEALHSRTLKWEPSRPLHIGWDFGYQRPAIVVTQVDIVGRWYILYEILGQDMPIDKFADQIVLPQVSQRFPNATAIYYGDPACLQRSDKGEQTTYQILLSKGILIHCKPSEYRLRKEIIDRMINTITDGVPHLLVDPRCHIVNDGFLGGYHYPLYDGDTQFTDKYSRPFHDNFYSHIFNALEYIAVHIFSPVKHKEKKRDYQPEVVMSNI